MTEEQQKEPFWKPLEAELEKALAQVRRGEVTSLVLLKAGPGIERVSDGYVPVFLGPEYDFVSILAQAGMARVNLEQALTASRDERAYMSQLQAMLEQADPETKQRLTVDLEQLTANGVTPLP